MTDQLTSQSAEAAPGKTPVVFVTDASVDAARVGDVLRAAGYDVADVPRSMLLSRVVSQLPNVVLLDVDADGVLDDVAKVRALPGSGAIDFVYFGTATGPITNADEALANQGSAFFLRPVDVGGLLRRLEALTGGPRRRASMSPSTPPPSIPASRGLFGGVGLGSPAAFRDSLPPSSKPPSGSDRPVVGSERPSPPSLPSPGVRVVGAPHSAGPVSLADLVDPPRSLASLGNVSSELQQLLADAELRAETSSSDLPFPTPEEEIEAVLPVDLLAALDEPLDGDEEDDFLEPGRASVDTSPGREGTGARGATTSGVRQPTTGGSFRAESSAQTRERRNATSSAGPVPVSAASPAAGRPPTGGTPAGAAPSMGAPANTPSGSGTSGDAVASPVSRGPSLGSPSALRAPDPPSVVVAPFVLEDAAFVDAPRAKSSLPNVPATRSSLPAPEGTTDHPPADQGITDLIRGVVFGPGDARKFFADAIVRRVTGALVFEQDGVTRRVLLRDGDLVTAASWSEQESLVQFLGARGDLPRDEVQNLAAKIFPYGRYAGAALIARGWVGQDQLWSVLRAHAEWIASMVVAMPAGVGRVETELPERLRDEPNVFGASTGSAIYVDLVRRTVAPEEAVERLGGESSRIVDGSRYALIAECNLSGHETDLLARTRGGTLADVLARAVDPEIASVVHALALLGIVEVVPSLEASRPSRKDAGAEDARALDEEAVRARVRARLELVEDGDYFAILGVARTSTSYEIRRAYVELRRAFEPSRILAPPLADLDVDVRKILAVLDEAYEILRDGPRRERYRRAIEARPA